MCDECKLRTWRGATHGSGCGNGWYGVTCTDEPNVTTGWRSLQVLILPDNGLTGIIPALDALTVLENFYNNPAGDFVQFVPAGADASGNTVGDLALSSPLCSGSLRDP